MFSFKTHAVQEKFIAKLVSCKVNFTGKTDVALVIHAIGVFSVKFTVEFTSSAMNFSIEKSKEKDLIIKAATGNIKTRTIRNFYVHKPYRQ